LLSPAQGIPLGYSCDPDSIAHITSALPLKNY